MTKLNREREREDGTAKKREKIAKHNKEMI